MLHVEPRVTVVVPDADASLFDVVANARAAGMHVVSNGKMIIVCSVIPAGWERMNWVKERPRIQNRGYPPIKGGETALPVRLSPETMPPDAFQGRFSSTAETN